MSFSEWDRFFEYALVAINTAVAIAGGIVIAMVLTNIVVVAKKKWRAAHE